MTTRKKTERPPLSVAAALAKFYRDNPGEWLTLDDIQVKFGCALSTAQLAITDLKHAGRIERISVYRVPEAACS